MDNRSEDLPTIVVAHPYLDVKSFIDAWDSPPPCLWARSRNELLEMLPQADILATMTWWEQHYFSLAPRLRLVQAMSSGTDQYDPADFRAHGVHLASARGVNANAVAEHALGLLLTLSRRLHEARDDQHRRIWPKLYQEAATRRQELSGSHVVVVGFGAIGSRLVAFCRALGMKVTVVRRDTSVSLGPDIHVVNDSALPDVVGNADHVVLTCPATPETQGLLNSNILQRMKPTATLVNVARGSVVVEADLIAALQEGKLAAAALDTFEKEPLPATSPLWDMKNVVITPHAAGDTVAYEQRVADILRENLRRLKTGTDLVNQVV
ncbi:D-2-hydroxyacid dehydrogenase [Acetobacter estunensis]|uniref:D-2-hydroxyacid dehydrogenase n=1 Tax=Acetobacter estunensis TaxID=104097 RepID=A0A967BAV8_9PROT|nr:D-2-hydroxyacid dehydrogenase [Acetobacter estunensis]